MVHDMEPEECPIDVRVQRYLQGRRPEVLFTGHTHYERLVARYGVLQINTGSPTQPHLLSDRLGSVGALELATGFIEATIVALGHTPGARNPSRPQSRGFERLGA
jgi:predicted phosphodiesterase